MRLVVKFGDKKRYSDQECEAIYQELVAAQSLRLNRQPSFNRADDILPLLHLVAQKSGKRRQPPGGTHPGG
jgi:hypothetical protein